MTLKKLRALDSLLEVLSAIKALGHIETWPNSWDQIVGRLSDLSTTPKFIKHDAIEAIKKASGDIKGKGVAIEPKVKPAEEDNSEPPSSTLVKRHRVAELDREELKKARFDDSEDPKGDGMGKYEMKMAIIAHVKLRAKIDFQIALYLRVDKPEVTATIESIENLDKYKTGSIVAEPLGFVYRVLDPI
ncbi:hypothetical protein L6452_31023 [Arctium lappa]|uniref:Uncharacterized protein n=1 Tax=Arctium lappa TaxID=4217 RepID=A0ACB8ZKS6_ARCLA|nr:hypothetical protein L6452_31023 [Arctium lappa]